METILSQQTIQNLAAKVKQFAYNLSDLEIEVEAATNNDSWGPTSSQLQGMITRH